MINVLELEPGTRVRLADNAIAEVVSNPRDGVWIELRYVDVPDDPSRVGAEELVFAETIVELA
jgi:hypothetical protein